MCLDYLGIVRWHCRKNQSATVPPNYLLRTYDYLFYRLLALMSLRSRSRSIGSIPCKRSAALFFAHASTPPPHKPIADAETTVV